MSPKTGRKKNCSASSRGFQSEGGSAEDVAILKRLLEKQVGEGKALLAARARENELRRRGVHKPFTSCDGTGDP